MKKSCVEVKIFHSLNVLNAQSHPKASSFSCNGVAKCESIAKNECLWLSIQIIKKNTEASANQKDAISAVPKAKAKPVVEMGVAFLNDPNFLAVLAMGENTGQWIGKFRFQMAADGQFQIGNRGWVPEGLYYDLEVPFLEKLKIFNDSTGNKELEPTIREANTETASSLEESQQNPVYTLEIDSRSQTINFYVDGVFLIATPSFADEWIQDFRLLEPRVRINESGYRVDIVPTPKKLIEQREKFVQPLADTPGSLEATGQSSDKVQWLCSPFSSISGYLVMHDGRIGRKCVLWRTPFMPHESHMSVRQVHASNGRVAIGVTSSRQLNDCDPPLLEGAVDSVLLFTDSCEILADGSLISLDVARLEAVRPGGLVTLTIDVAERRLGFAVNGQNVRIGGDYMRLDFRNLRPVVLLYSPGDAVELSTCEFDGTSVNKASSVELNYECIEDAYELSIESSIDSELEQYEEEEDCDERNENQANEERAADGRPEEGSSGAMSDEKR